MDASRIVKFDPWLLGAIQKGMGELPAIPGDLAKVKSLTFFDGERVSAEPGTLLKGWMEAAPGDFMAIGKMTNLHTLLFRNRRLLKVGDFGFLTRCRKLKKLDLRGTDFTDCELLAALPALKYALLPDRRSLIHTQVLEEIEALTESERERDERSRAEVYIEAEKGRESVGPRAGDGSVKGTGLQPERVYAADARLIGWIAACLGRMPDKPGDLAQVRLLDSRKRNSVKGNPPSWLVEKEGDFSLLGELPNLQALLLWGVSAEDFSFLSKCVELRYLNLWETNFTDCSLLVNLPFLGYVCLPPWKQLVNYPMLAACQTEREQKARGRLEGFLHRDEGSGEELEQDLAESRKLHISCESAWNLRAGSGGQAAVSAPSKGKEGAGQAWERDREESVRQSGIGMEGRSSQQSGAGMEGGLAQRSDEAGQAEMAMQQSGASMEAGLAQQGGMGEALYRKEDFEGMRTVRGEDVVISWEGGSRIRYVSAEFVMDGEPPLWKLFSRLEEDEEEDNWAKLSPWKAKLLTRELLKAVLEGNVSTVFLSLEPWGEDHLFTLDFAGGWANVIYMDDETGVHYESYNPAYPDPAELSPVEFGGQTPIPKMLALEDLELAAKIVQHILEKGQLLPGTLWMTDGGR